MTSRGPGFTPSAQRPHLSNVKAREGRLIPSRPEGRSLNPTRPQDDSTRLRDFMRIKNPTPAPAADRPDCPGGPAVGAPPVVRACYIRLRSGWGSDDNVYNALRG